MRAGDLDRRITIRKHVETQSSSGFPAESWTEVAEVWAAIKYGRGNETEERGRAPQEAGTSRVTFRVRWSPDTRELTTEHSILYDGRVYDVVDTREIGRREGVEIDATVRSEKQIDDT